MPFSYLCKIVLKVFLGLEENNKSLSNHGTKRFGALLAHLLKRIKNGIRNLTL
jgi:hypothetical protein